MEISSIMKDRQTSPLEKAIFSIEHLLRHKNVLEYRSSNARSLNFLQYHSIDVIAFLLTAILTIIIVLKKIVSYVYVKIINLKPSTRNTKIGRNGAKKNK